MNKEERRKMKEERKKKSLKVKFRKNGVFSITEHLLVKIKQKKIFLCSTPQSENKHR